MSRIYVGRPSYPNHLVEYPVPGIDRKGRLKGNFAWTLSVMTVIVRNGFESQHPSRVWFWTTRGLSLMSAGCCLF